MWQILDLNGNIFGKRVFLIRFNLKRGSDLPFYLLKYTQFKILHRNCNSSSCSDNKFITVGCKFCNDTSKFSDLRSSMAYISAATKREPHVSLWNQRRVIDYIYYTEADQILSFYNFETMDAVSKANNDSTIIVGRRRFKRIDVIESTYNTNLNRGRGCGAEGYYFDHSTDFKIVSS